MQDADSPSAGSSAGPSGEQIEGMQKMVHEMAAQFLAAALKQILQAISRAFHVQQFVDDNSAAFVDFRPGGEHLLEWTSIHQEYCDLIDGVITTTLAQLDCTSEQIFEYARAMGGDPRADKHLSRLLAMSDYNHFCDMMRHASEEGPCSV